MPANALILPLLAGYLFVHFSTRFRYRAQALDGYRLLLESAVAGFFLAALSRLFILVVKGVYPSLSPYWRNHITDIPYVGTGALAITIGILLPLMDNRRPRSNLLRTFIRSALLARRLRRIRRAVIRVRQTYRANRRAAMDREIRLHGNALTRLLHQAASNNELLSVTMRSRKWYVGYVAEAVNLEPQESYFRLLPILSGYRKSDDLRTRRMIYYRDVYSRLQARPEDRPDLTIFIITLALADVEDARIFSEAVYHDHFGGPPERLIRVSH